MYAIQQGKGMMLGWHEAGNGTFPVFVGSDALCKMRRIIVMTVRCQSNGLIRSDCIMLYAAYRAVGNMTGTCQVNR